MRAAKVVPLACAGVFAVLCLVGLVCRPVPDEPRYLQRAEELLGVTVTITAHTGDTGYMSARDAISAAFGEVLRAGRRTAGGVGAAPPTAETRALAADRAAAELRRLGVRHGIVRAGGHYAAVGPQFDGQPWQIPVPDPDPGAEKPLGYFSLDGLSAAVLPGKEGEAVASVTVVAGRAVEAEKLGRELLASGPDVEAETVKQSPGASALIVTVGEGDLIESRSVGRFPLVGDIGRD